VALYLHHPGACLNSSRLVSLTDNTGTELRTVWDDLDVQIKPVTPEKAPQPAGLKLKLLPFQQESLFWMRNQEKTTWAGGMLAVSFSSLRDFRLEDGMLIAFYRMRWGELVGI
jgi:hypothetical protein